MLMRRAAKNVNGGFLVRRLSRRSPSIVRRQHEFAGMDRAHWRPQFTAISAGLAAIGVYALWKSDSELEYQVEVPGIETMILRDFKEGDEEHELPIITRKEVERHTSEETGIWVTYKDHVYDITDFVRLHPGGTKKILLAAGKAIDPFWSVYQVHFSSDNAKQLLDDMKIGRLDMKSRTSVEPTVSDVFSNDPWAERSPLMSVITRKPFDAETPLDSLVDNFYTPNSIFFVRNHLPVPLVDIEKYKLCVEGEGLRSVELSLAELKTKFVQHTISATIQCAGNRRSELSKFKAVNGLGAGHAGISTATWKGVKLRDVLMFAGHKADSDACHIEFEGLDKDMTGEAYAVSIPVEKAFSEDGDVLLAYEMNGGPLPRDHGFPLRVVVPGSTGARNAKWLSKIRARKDESPGTWQQNDYKVFPPNVSPDNADFTSVAAIQETPVQSVIVEPQDGSLISMDDEVITIKGYAFSGGGRGIMRVDVSLDGGSSWQQAELQDDIEQPYGKRWAWTLWTIDVPIPQHHAGNLNICCKAVDSASNSQPERVESVWNFRGFLNNAWHRVEVRLDDG